MASRKDGGTVFQGYAYDFGLKVCCKHELVGDRRGKQVAWGHIAGRCGASDGLSRGVADAIDVFAGGLVDPVIAGDAVNGRDGAREDGAVADGGERREVADVGIFAGEAIVEEAFEAACSIAVVITIEVVPAHLVDDDADY